LAGFTVDEPEIALLGRETIFRDGQQVGWLTSGGHGYTVANSIGYGYVRNPDGVAMDWLTSGRYELEVATERVPATIHLAPLYDPRMERIKC
jgi:4-methylaminobutanoate oxidase (formaldehyde-forming)